jgi:TRAP-type C4-dicarboxylate transport system permease small subunit
MSPSQAPRTPRWYGIPVRVLLATFVGTLICFAVSLLIGILGTAIASAVRGIHPDMRIAYRMIALPIGGVAGTIIFILSLIMEIRHYRQTEALSGIERMG